MTLLWSAFIGLFVLRLIKRHGWEYVPLVVFAFGVWMYAGSHDHSGVGDTLLLAATAGVHVITRKG